MTERFAVARHRLMFDGQELLAGPEDELRDMAATLNRHPPAAHEVGDAVLSLIWLTRGCSFAPAGPVLAAIYDRKAR